MKLGVNLINFGEHATPEFLKERTLFAEELGYHFVMISDHVAITPDVRAQHPAPFFDPLAALAWLAGLTKRVELGTTVLIVPYRHPLLTAQIGLAIDRISGGRFILGVGVGWARQEFEALGVPFEKRGEITDDHLRAIKTLWTSDIASHSSPFVSFDGVHTGVRPVRAPHPPIWVGGNGGAGMRRAVRLGDGWHPINIKARWLKDEGMPRLREISHEEGKPVPKLQPRIRLRITDVLLDEDERVAGEGTLDQIHQDLETLDELGAECVLLDTLDTEPEVTPERARIMLTTLADEVFDLERQRLR